MKRCAIFWEGQGWWLCELPAAGKHSQGPHDSLDRVIRAAHAAGFEIDRVQATRGQLPGPARTEGVDGHQSA
jgi:hypothetical protein